MELWKYFSFSVLLVYFCWIWRDSWYSLCTSLSYHIIGNRDTRFLLGAPVKGVAERTKNIYPRGRFHRRSEAAASPLASDASLWFRERLIPHYLLFVCLGDVCVFPSAFDSHLDHLFLDSLVSSLSSRARVTGKRLRRLFNETFPRFSNPKRWKRSETVEESASEKRQRFGGGEEGSISAIQ